VSDRQIEAAFIAYIPLGDPLKGGDSSGASVQLDENDLAPTVDEWWYLLPPFVILRALGGNKVRKISEDINIGRECEPRDLCQSLVLAPGARNIFLPFREAK
jgi:hypothetical protein